MGPPHPEEPEKIPREENCEKEERDREMPRRIRERETRKFEMRRRIREREITEHEMYRMIWELGFTGHEMFRMIREWEFTEHKRRRLILEELDREIVRILAGLSHLKAVEDVAWGTSCGVMDRLYKHSSIDIFSAGLMFHCIIDEQQKMKTSRFWRLQNAVHHNKTGDILTGLERNFLETRQQENLEWTNFAYIVAGKRKLWMRFLQNYFRTNDSNIKCLKGHVGIVTRRFKMATLKRWKLNNEEIKDRKTKMLIHLAREFLEAAGPTGDEENLPFAIVCDAVIDAIPDDSWMRFVRLKLRLSENVIKALRQRYAAFSEEQKFQMVKQWVLESQQRLL